MTNDEKVEDQRLKEEVLYPSEEELEYFQTQWVEDQERKALAELHSRRRSTLR
jgi:hypothetical protein